MTTARKRRMLTGLEVATKIVGICAVPIFFYQQYASYVDKKTERTFELVKEFRGRELESLRRTLSQGWNDARGEIGLINTHGGLTISDRDELVRAIVGKDRSRVDAAYSINEYLEAVIMCIRANHCDRGTADAYFADYTVEFYCLYGVILRDRRSQLAMKKYGSTLEAFVAEKRKSC